MDILKDLERRGRLVDILTHEEQTTILARYKKDNLKAEIDRMKAQVITLNNRIAELETT